MLADVRTSGVNNKADRERDDVKGASLSWRQAICAALALSMASTAGIAAPRRFVAETPVARVDYWQQRASDVTRQLSTARDLPNVKLVFIGDSITDFWHFDTNPWFRDKYCGRAIWDESFGGAVPDQYALNLGVSGDRIEHVLHRLLPSANGGEGWLDRAELRPRYVFLMLGINNSFDSEDPAVASIVAGIEATIASIHARKPDARIVVQSLLPTDDDRKNRELVMPINAQLRTLATTTPGLAWLDLYSGFVDGTGTQQRALFNDGLHPSRDGYRVWRDRLVAFLKAAG
jgi:lysophospholipase L1-like esterase